jgi:hypothetical protein
MSKRKYKVPLTSFNYEMEKKLIKKNKKNLINFSTRNLTQKKLMFKYLNFLTKNFKYLKKKLNQKKLKIFMKNILTQDIYNLMKNFFFPRKKSKIITNFFFIYPTLTYNTKILFFHQFFTFRQKLMLIKILPFFLPKFKKKKFVILQNNKYNKYNRL